MLGVSNVLMRADLISGFHFVDMADLLHLKAIFACRCITSLHSDSLNLSKLWPLVFQCLQIKQMSIVYNVYHLKLFSNRKQILEITFTVRGSCNGYELMCEPSMNVKNLFCADKQIGANKKVRQSINLERGTSPHG